MNSNRVCPEGRNVIKLYIAINFSTTQHFQIVFIAHDLQYLVNKHVQPFPWEICQHYRHYRAFF